MSELLDETVEHDGRGDTFHGILVLHGFLEEGDVLVENHSGLISCVDTDEEVKEIEVSDS